MLVVPRPRIQGYSENSPLSMHKPIILGIFYAYGTPVYRYTVYNWSLYMYIYTPLTSNVGCHLTPVYTDKRIFYTGLGKSCKTGKEKSP